MHTDFNAINFDANPARSALVPMEIGRAHV